MKVQRIFALSALSSTLAMAKLLPHPSGMINHDKIPDEGPVNACVNDYCSQTGEYCGEWVGATVRRLPFWGDEVPENYVNFEWPTQQQFDQMSPDTKIQSLDLKSTNSHGNSYFGSVKVNLSNGEQSPVFENQYYDQWTNQQTIEFNQDVSIRAVDSTFKWQYIYALQFYDGNEELAQEYVSGAPQQYVNYEYDPSSRYELAENEELIGVYGVKDYTTSGRHARMFENLTVFGFLVKVKPEQSTFTCPAYTPEPVQPDDTPLPIDSYVIPSNDDEDSQEDERVPVPSFVNKNKNKFIKKYFKDQAKTEEDQDAIETLFDDIFSRLAEEIEDFNNN